MDIIESELYKAQAAVFKALGHPTRLLIVDTLARQPTCVADLTDLAECDMSTISRHLSRLQRAGIVDSERRGRQVYYRLLLPCVCGFFACVEKALRDSARRQLQIVDRRIPSSAE